ncbi:hypothetical protein B0H34DRAFT_800787 [Crassisporium funariophilum]|nr:hypothetical protein B0H34DRAFT_800787 [Crassisporium funariophilum]
METQAARIDLPNPEEGRPPLVNLDINRQAVSNDLRDQSVVPHVVTDQPEPFLEFQELDGYYNDNGRFFPEDWWPVGEDNGDNRNITPGGGEDEAVVGREHQEELPAVPVREVGRPDPIACPLPPPPVQVQVQPQFHDIYWRQIGGIDVQTPGSDVNEANRPDIVPRAFSEESCIRIAYLQAVIANVYSHVSVLQATDILNGTLDALLSAGVLPVYPQPV